MAIKDEKRCVNHREFYATRPITVEEARKACSRIQRPRLCVDRGDWGCAVMIFALAFIVLCLVVHYTERNPQSLWIALLVSLSTSVLFLLVRFAGEYLAYPNLLKEFNLLEKKIQKGVVEEIEVEIEDAACVIDSNFLYLKLDCEHLMIVSDWEMMWHNYSRTPIANNLNAVRLPGEEWFITFILSGHKINVRDIEHSPEILDPKDGDIKCIPWHAVTKGAA